MAIIRLIKNHAQKFDETRIFALRRNNNSFGDNVNYTVDIRFYFIVTRARTHKIMTFDCHLVECRQITFEIV